MLKLTKDGVFSMLATSLLGVLFFGQAPIGHAAETCLDYPFESVASEDEREIFAIYQSVATALGPFPSLTEALAIVAPELCISSQMEGAHAYLDFNSRRIVIDVRLPKAMQSAVLLHELRHLEQFSRGSCPSDDLAMGEYARATFAMEADASAISLLIAWSMKENGDSGAWDALSSSQSQSDIAKSFANEMAVSGEIAHAVSAAFSQWYASSARREQYYFAACSGYLDRQDTAHTLPLYHLIPDRFLETLCVLPDGNTYTCSHPEFEPH